MARTDTLPHFLTDVADAIREKGGTSELIQASDFDTAIENLPSGGGSDTHFVVLEDNANGQVTKAKIQNMTAIPRYYLYPYSGGGVIHFSAGLTDIEFPNNLTSFGDYCFWSLPLTNVTSLPATTTTLGSRSFGRTSANIKRIPDNIATIGAQVFQQNTVITQLSTKKFPGSYREGYSSDNMFGNITNIVAFWAGEFNKFGRYSFVGETKMTHLFINAPRATVEADANYQYAFSNNAFNTDVIICNDDEGWLTQEEFDAIDWANLT